MVLFFNLHPFSWLKESWVRTWQCHGVPCWMGSSLPPWASQLGCCIEDLVGLGSPSGCSLATDGCRMRAWCAGSHGHQSCVQAKSVDFLPGFSTCCPGCCFWRMQDVLGKVHGNRGAQGEQTGLLFSPLHTAAWNSPPLP